MADGWPPADARHEARRRFGNVGRSRETFHDSRNISWLEDLGRDVRYAIRTLTKDRVYVLAAVAALGIALAANIALFSLFSAVALKPLPVPAPDRLVSIYQVNQHNSYGPFSLADYLFYRDNSHSVTAIAAAQPSHLRLAGTASSPSGAPVPPSAGAVAEPVIALFVTANYFDVFGVRPVAGRSLVPGDEQTGAAFSALISENYWERRFGRDPSIIGSTLFVSGMRATIVGVTPRGFAGVRQEVPDLWITIAALGDVRARAARETTTCCALVGSLAPGVSIAQTQAELASLAKIRAADLPAADRKMTVLVTPAVSFGVIATLIRPLFAALQVAMMLLLLIACANVAGLLLSRAAARHREIAVRLATGASRRRIVRQLVTEGVVLAVVAGTVATIITAYGLAAATRLTVAFLSQQGGGTLALSISANARLIIYVAVISIGAGVIFSLAPALQASRLDLVSSLKTSSGALGIGKGRLRAWLIGGQIAVSVGLLIAAAGLARSASALLSVDLGFASPSVLTVWLTNPEELGIAPQRAREIERLVRERIVALPGVQSLAVASRLPLGGNVTASAMLPGERAGDPASRDVAAQYPFTFVSQDYFATLGIRVLRGRTFTADEVRDSARVVVISDALARALWPNDDAVGKQLAMGVTKPTDFNAVPESLTGLSEVIGVVHDVHGLQIGAADGGDVYLPKLTNGWSSRIVLLSHTDLGATSRDVERIVRSIEPALPVSLETMDGVVATNSSLAAARVGAGALATIGVVGLILAAVGVYGMVSFTVRQDRRDIGIRTALGAQPYQVIGAIIRGTARPIAVGVVVGAALGAAGIKLSNALLQIAAVHSSVFDPVVVVAVPLAIAALALMTAYLSSRKATLIDPTLALRADG